MLRIRHWLLVGLLACSLGLPRSADAADKKEIERTYLRRAEENIKEYRMDRATVVFRTDSGDSAVPQRVEIQQLNHDFLFGCIAFPLVWAEDLYRPERFKRRFTELFNFAILPFYWGAYEQKPGRPRWQQTVSVARWARENDITLKGHPLVWTHPAGVPGWIADFPKASRNDLLKARVMSSVAGFKNSINMWDVVNEPTHTRAWTNWDADDYVSEPVDRMADYVEKCHRWAHTANPEAALILNDFEIMTDRDRRDRFAALVRELTSRDVPLSGLGLQAHEPRYEWFSPPEVWKTLDRMSDLGYPLHVTEFIPTSGGHEITGEWKEGTWTEQNQADYAAMMYKLWFGHPDVQSINWWGLSDRDIWLEGGGLVDEEYEPKPVYRRLHDLIHNRWTTRVTVQDVPDEGRVSFRGFHGDYRVTVHVGDGEVREFTKHLGPEGPHRWTLAIED